MNNIFVYPEALEKAKSNGVAAVFFETRTAPSRGSNYTSFSLEILPLGQDYATLLLIGEQVNGCAHYAEQLAADAMRKLGLSDKFHFRCSKFVKKAEHIKRPTYTAMPSIDDVLKGDN